MASINVTAFFYDEKKNLIAEVSARTDLSILKPGQKTPFQIYLPLHSSSAPSSYRLSAVGLESDKEPPRFLKIKNLKAWVDKEGFYKVSGEVYNNGSLIARSARVICAFHSSDGRLLAISDSVTDPVSIAPGGKSYFEISSFPIHLTTGKYDLYVAVHHYERVTSANWMLFSVLIVITAAFLIYMKRRGW